MNKKIKKVTLEMIAEKGLANLTRAELCKRADIPEGSFQFHMGVTFTEFVALLQNKGITGPDIRIDRGRANPDLRRESILQGAIRAAKLYGWKNISREEVATEAHVSVSTVSHYFKAIGDLHTEVMREAIRSKIPLIIAQGLVVRDPLANTASEALKKQAVKILCRG